MEDMLKLNQEIGERLKRLASSQRSPLGIDEKPSKRL